MTRRLKHVSKLPWMLAVLTLSLCCASARAETPPRTQEFVEKESLDQWRRKSARRVLALFDSHSLAVGKDGSLWVWGQGPGDWVGTWPEIEVASGTPIRMPGMQRVVSVAVANDYFLSPGLALMEDGTVQAWGQDNSFGQLGDGTTLPRQTRVTVQGLDRVVAIATSGSSLAVRENGTVWGWGSNACGKLGDGTRENRPSPVQVTRLTDVVAVAAGWGHSMALRADGTVWTWGCGWTGVLGDGTRMDHLQPIQVPGLTDVVAIETRTSTSYALRADGTVWAWGDISEGQHGQVPQDGISIQPVPVQIPGLSKVVSLSAGYAHALAVRRDGTVWGWGSNRGSQLGDGGQGPSGPVRQVQGLHGVEVVTAGRSFSMALKRDGTLWGWGHNNTGGLGTGSDRRLSPSLVALTDVRALSSSADRMLALRTDGTVWTWGAAVQLVGPEHATPARVQGLDGVAKIAMGGSHMLALRTDGSLWGWGTNGSGQVGDGTTTTRLTPVPVVNLTGVVEMAAGASHSLALRTDGTVWAWGANYYGQLGDMTLQNRSTPVQVQGLTDAVAVFASGGLSLALREDGSVWWWGSIRSAWRRGDRQPHAPEPVQGLTNIVKLASALDEVYAVRANGTVWKWVPGVPGEVNPAQQVAGFTDAVDVACNSSFLFTPFTSPQTHSTLYVLRADGTVWTDGNNLLGERGFPSSFLTPPGPSQVPGLTGVVSIAASELHAHALRADGTVVGWGENIGGVIGDGMPPYHPTPVHVPLPCRLTTRSSCEDRSGQP